jgi:hypothetical protein
MKPKQIIITSLIALIMLSCTSKQYPASPLPASSPDIGVPLDNKSLEVAAPQGWNSLATDGSLFVMIRNASDQQILINQVSGIRIFAFAANKWVEVKNKATYSPVEVTIDPSPSYDPTKLGETLVVPDLAGYPKASKIRIFIIGTLIGNQQNTPEIASYVDVALNP